MNIIFHIEERRLLSENGKIIAELPVSEWEGDENNSLVIDEGEADRLIYTLTNRQIEEAIDSWNGRTSEIVHQPVMGQISMEEAIQNGEIWLENMGIEESGKKVKGDFVNATLGIPEQKEFLRQGEYFEQLEPYYSFWTVQFSDMSKNAVLYINAVTGKVLGAEVYLYSNLPDKFPVEKLSLFVELAELKAKDSEMVVDTEGAMAFFKIADSRLCAEMEFQYRQKGYFDLTHYGQDNADVSSDIYYNEYAVITYKLIVSGE